MAGTAFQDLIPDNSCFGCGRTNQHGLQIKSYWDGPNESVCSFQPHSHHNAGPGQFVNGGIIATLIDCHTICTATADAYRREGREIGTEPAIWYVTGSLSVRYQRPAAIAVPLELRAQLVEVGQKKARLTCSVRSQGEECAQGEVVAIRVPPSWRGSF